MLSLIKAANIECEGALVDAGNSSEGNKQTTVKNVYRDRTRSPTKTRIGRKADLSEKGMKHKIS